MKQQRRYHQTIAQEESGYVLNPERSYFAVVIPEDTINLVHNPEIATLTNYHGIGATAVQTTTAQRRGLYGALVTPSVDMGGIYYLLSGELGNSNHTFSVDVKGPARLQLYFGDDGGNITGRTLTFDAPAFWDRISLTDLIDGSIQSVGIRSVDGSPFYCDGFQVESKAYATTFVSGTIETPADLVAEGQAHYGWLGPAHSSESFRTRWARTGGRPVALSDLGLEVTDFMGFGHLAPDLTTVQMAMRSDRLYVGAILPERQFTVAGYVHGDGMLKLLTRRGSFATPIAGNGAEPAPILLHIQLYDNTQPVSELMEIECVYVGGLEGTINNPYQEKVAINFRAWRPFMRSDGNRAQALELRDVAKNSMNHVGIYANGSVDLLDSPGYMDDEYLPFRFAAGRDGALYVPDGVNLYRYFAGEWTPAYEVDGDSPRIVDVTIGPGYILYMAIVDEEDGSETGTVLAYNYSTGATSVPGGGALVFGRDSDSDEDPFNLRFGRLRYDAATHKLYVSGNFLELSTNGGNPTCNGVAVYNAITNTWSGIPDVIPDREHYQTTDDWMIWDARTDKWGDLWVCGQFHRMTAEGKALTNYPKTTLPWGLAIYKADGTWMYPTDWTLVGGNKAEMLSDASVAHTRNISTTHIEIGLAESSYVFDMGSGEMVQVFSTWLGNDNAVNATVFFQETGEYRKIVSVEDSLNFTVDKPIRLNGFTNTWNYETEPTNNTTRWIWIFHPHHPEGFAEADCGGRVLCPSPSGDGMYVGGEFNGALRVNTEMVQVLYYDPVEMPIAVATRPVSRGVVFISKPHESWMFQAGDKTVNLFDGLAPYCTSATEWVDPIVSDMEVSPDGKALWIVGAFVGWGSPPGPIIPYSARWHGNAPPSLHVDGPRIALRAPGIVGVSLANPATVSWAPLPSPIQLPSGAPHVTADYYGYYMGYGSSLAMAPTGLSRVSNMMLPIDDFEDFAPPSGIGEEAAPVTPNSFFASFTGSDASRTIGTGQAIVNVTPGARASARIEVRGPCVLERIANATTGKIMATKLTIAANEVIVLSFSPGPVWVRSTAKGVIDYPSYGADSFPDLGLIDGNNRIVISTTGVGAGAYAIISWREEFASIDSLLNRES